jgi:hypothetical protein
MVLKQPWHAATTGGLAYPEHAGGAIVSASWPESTISRVVASLEVPASTAAFSVAGGAEGGPDRAGAPLSSSILVGSSEMTAPGPASPFVVHPTTAIPIRHMAKTRRIEASLL